MGEYSSAMFGLAVLIAGVVASVTITSAPAEQPAPVEVTQPAPVPELDDAISQVLSESPSSAVGPAGDLPVEVIRVLVAHGAAVTSDPAGADR
jgi:hypothetical protein